MTYATDAAKASRKPITVVEIDFDNVISDAGVERFCDGDVPLSQKYEPCITSIQYSPVKITDAGLGYRCTTTVVFQDFPHPSGVGTYFGRLIGSNQYYIDRRLTVYRGFQHSSFSLSNLKRADYFIKKIEGPDDRGYIKITAADILTKLDGEQAQWPPITYGSLSASLTSGATGSTNIVDNDNFAAPDYALIDDEIVAYSAITGGNSITISARGQFGTAAAAHDAGASVRRVAGTTGTNPVDFIYNLIDAATGIDASTYINSTEWDDVRDTYFANDEVYGVILEPTPVKDIITSVCEQFSIAVFWDDEAQLIKIKALGPTVAATKTINHVQHILSTGHNVIRDQSKALSQIWVYFGKINHADGDQPSNYSSIYVYQDTEAQGASGLQQPIIKKIFAPHIADDATGSASKLAYRLVSRLKYGSYEIKFRLDPNDAEAISLNCGDHCEITSDLIQTSDGSDGTQRFYITEKARLETYVEFTAIYSGVEVGSRYGLVAPNATVNYGSATTEQRQTYCWIASSTNDQLSNGDSAYLMT